jgi:uncharacterized YceG family protein
VSYHGGRRRRPSPRQLLIRRVLALVLLVGGLAALVGLAAAALGGGGEDEAPATTAAAPKPQPKPLRIVFPEGFTRFEMGDRIAEVNTIAQKKRKVTPRLKQKQYLALTGNAKLVPADFTQDADPKPTSLEGVLFPATYEFTARTTTRQLVQKQLQAFKRSWAKVDLAYAKTKNLTPYDVLIIASMVEEETLAPEERPLVAAVIYNRLKAGMALGIDATIRYGLQVPGTEPLRQSHLDSDTPYNTRRFPGLPPTPIANPGLAALQAAAHPKEVDYLFFVRKPDKVHHFFTASESEFYAKACEYGFGCG